MGLLASEVNIIHVSRCIENRATIENSKIIMFTSSTYPMLSFDAMLRLNWVKGVTLVNKSSSLQVVLEIFFVLL